METHRIHEGESYRPHGGGGAGTTWREGDNTYTM